jgi:photosystem II stability/assembly factor-like uncharacterized protein
MKPCFLRLCSLSLTLAACTAVGSGIDKPESGTYAPMQPAVGGSWELVVQAATDQPIRIAAFGDPQFGLTGGPSETGKAFLTVDGGQTWSSTDGSADCLFGLDIVDSRVVWQCSSGPVRRSTDGGRTWDPASDYGNFCRQLNFLDSGTGWIADRNRLGLTRDGGRTWIPLALPGGGRTIAAIGLRAPGEGYLLDIRGSLFATTDGGAAWSALPLPLDLGGSELPDHDTASSAVRFTDPGHGLVVVHRIDPVRSQLLAFRTADAGKTWDREVVMDVPLVVSVYLSHDARTLTVTDKMESRFIVLRSREGG